MRIGDVAKAAGVTTSRIRFYEDEGILPPAPREANGYRSYPPGAVEAIGFIERAQQLGFSLREIGSALPDPYAQLPSGMAILVGLKAKLAEVDRHLAATRKVRTQLAAFIREFDDCAVEECAPPRADYAPKRRAA
ncbi:HTH-type transcriptional regulator CueR [Alphaproteobacteria bacterium SO-S41]|nr:HTH-type transcriptional regulator CueR [Alphaproteobacteria bacterium SO-S41]